MRRKTLVFSLLGVLILLCVSIVLLLSLFLAVLSKNPVSKSSYYDYQITEFNSLQKSRSGFVTINKPLEREEYIGYTNDVTSSLFIIKNFGGKKYECSGSCYCSREEDQKYSRRATGTVLTRGYRILLSAFSASMAFKIAEKTFHHQCVNGFSDTCDPSLVLSEVDSCEPEEVGKEPDDATSRGETGNEDFLGEVGEYYECKGRCISATEATQTNQNKHLSFLKDNPLIQEQLNKIPMIRLTREFNEEKKRVGEEAIGDCDKLTLESRQFVPESYELGFPLPEGIELPEGSSHMENIATYLFIGRFDEFCQSSSRLGWDKFTQTGLPHLELVENEIMKEKSEYEGSNTLSGQARYILGLIKAYRKDGPPFCRGKAFNMLSNEPNHMKNVKCFKVQ